MFREKIDLFYLYIQAARNEPLMGKETVAMLKEVAICFVKDTVKFILLFFRRKKKIPDFKEKKIVFANTYNNYEALKFLLIRYPGSLLVCSGGYVSKLELAINVRTLLHSINFGKYFFLIFLSLQSKFRVRHYQFILRDYGFVESYIRLLRDNRPACIFISNDHYPSSRAMMLAARELGIKCIYIQHASVTDHFPPMRASHALLYGQYSEDIYRNIKGSEGVFIKVGNHRFDSFKTSIAQKARSGKIGVAFNTRNSIAEVMNLCEYLALHFPPEDIILRPHPADRRKVSARFAISSKDENSLEYLKRIDVLIAGNSSILLEAAAMNVYPFQIYFDKVPEFLIDYYGFIKTGVAEEVKEKEILIARISEIFRNGDFKSRQATRLYDSSVGEPFEFDVENHIVSVVNRILSKEPV